MGIVERDDTKQAGEWGNIVVGVMWRKIRDSEVAKGKRQ